tara:strand:+ start:592 stop:870 length:279 start_codon:yes stop_codon:yes gene_type:complete
MIKKNHVYELLYLDLEELNYFKYKDEKHYKFKTILKYTEDEVSFKSLKDMHIRGNSKKEIINLHKELIIFLLHEDKLFSWIEGKDEKLNLVN